jgi:putative sigma-54 modulation protein
MKVTYTGQQEKFAPAQMKKLSAKLEKLAKLLDHRGGEREAHIILTSERHLRRAEITVNLHDHPMVGVAAEADQFTAILQAAEKLEKQVLKLQAKKRDTKREPKEAWPAGEPAAGAAPVIEETPERRVFKVNEYASRKPMTLEEALLEMDAGRDYVVYIDAETDRVAVLLRRRDGHLDLVEA